MILEGWILNCVNWLGMESKGFWRVEEWNHAVGGVKKNASEIAVKKKCISKKPIFNTYRCETKFITYKHFVKFIEQA